MTAMLELGRGLGLVALPWGVTGWGGPAARAAAARAAALGAEVELAQRSTRAIALAAARHDAAVESLRSAPVSPEEIEAGVRRLDYELTVAVLALLPPGADPVAVAAWWRGLSSAERDAIIEGSPASIGWLDGVPARDRDRANRVLLTRAQIEAQSRVAELEGQIDHLSPVWLHPFDALRRQQLIGQLNQAKANRDGLITARRTLAALGPEGFLLGVDSAGDGRIVVAVGDPDTAAHTAVWVPGVSTDLGDAGGDLDRVINIHDAADRLTAAPDDVSAIMWLGYDTPGVDVSALETGDARAGAVALDDFVDGLRADHVGDGQVTVIGHSYGSVVIGLAASQPGHLVVDDIVVAGSPGMDVGTVDALGIDPRHVWAGAAADDPISGSLGSIPGVHGPQPTDASFGANRFVVDTAGHSAYWQPGSQSLLAQAEIVVGDYKDVPLVFGSPPRSDDLPPMPSLVTAIDR